MASGRVFDFAFLTEVAWIGLAIAVVVAVFGSVLTGGPAFGVGCLVAAGIDTTLVIVASRRGQREIAANRIDGASAMMIVPIRVLVKAALLGAAIGWPWLLSFAGTAAGALCFDVTLAFVGSALAFGQGIRRNGWSR
jgi:hypothetical protein